MGWKLHDAGLDNDLGIQPKGTANKRKNRQIYNQTIKWLLNSRESKQSSKDNLQNREPIERENVCAHHTFESAARSKGQEAWGVGQWGRADAFMKYFYILIIWERIWRCAKWDI